MNIVYILLPLSLILAITFVTAFIWVVRSGQYDDAETPAYRALLDEK